MQDRNVKSGVGKPVAGAFLSAMFLTSSLLAQSVPLRTAPPPNTPPAGPTMQETAEWLTTRIPQFAHARYTYQVLKEFPESKGWTEEGVTSASLDKCTLQANTITNIEKHSSTTDYEVPLSDADRAGISVSEITNMSLQLGPHWAETAKALDDWDAPFTPSYWRVVIPTRGKSVKITRYVANGEVIPLNQDKTHQGYLWIPFSDREDARRVAKALQRAAELCGAKADPF